jgi:hypothetical protein
MVMLPDDDHQRYPVQATYVSLSSAFEELMSKTLLLVIVVAMVATGLWLFVTGLFFESETNIWYVVSGGWLIGLGGDRLWRDFVAPVLGFEEG